MQLESGFVLFRGCVDHEPCPGPERWYTNNLATARVYGGVSVYQSRAKITVLDMADVGNIENLSLHFPAYAKMEGVNRHLFDRCFMLQDKNVLRNSEFVADTVITKFFAYCQRENIVDASLHGFGAQALAPSHHWEVFLSSPPELTLVKKVPITPDRHRLLRMNRQAAQRCREKISRRLARPKREFGKALAISLDFDD